MICDLILASLGIGMVIVFLGAVACVIKSIWNEMNCK